MRKFITLLFIVTILASEGQAAGDPGAGKEKSQVCAACHAADGNSIQPVWPKIAGQHPEYLVKQLTDYRNGDRENAQMSPMAANLSDEDIADLAAFYSSQKVQHGSTDPAVLRLGEKIYRAGNLEAGVPACLACHGPTGRGNPVALYPALAGQHAAYTQAQLDAFRSAARKNDANGVMRTVVSRMTEEEIRAVSEYIQGLH